MNKRQNSYMEMFRGVRNWCEANAAVFATKPFFKNPYDAFKANIPLIEAALVVQDTPTSAETADKNLKREGLLEVAERFRLALKSYASNPLNAKMLNTLPKNFDELRRASDDALLGKATRIVNTATPVVAGLAPYGILPADLDTLNDNILNFGEAVGTPFVARKIVKDATEDIDSLINGANDILRSQLDPAAMALKVLSPEFVQQYFLVREIDDPAYHRLALRLHVSDSVTHEPVDDAEVRIEPGAIRRRTTELGNCQVDHMDPGIIQIIVQKFGYTTQSLNAPINDGNTTELVVMLVKEG